MLIGNKIDLENKRKIDNETIKKFAEKKEMKYFEASAKEGINIDNIFRELAELILFNKSKEENEEETIRNRNRENSFNLSFDSIEPIKKKTCC